MFPMGLTPESIQKHFRKVRMCMFGYLQAIAEGPELESHVKKGQKYM